MIDSQSAVSEALFAALEAAIGVTAIADVWQNPPEDSQPVAKGLVIIGPVMLDAGEEKGGGLDKAIATIFTYMRRPDITELYALNFAVRAALEGQSMTAAGAIISAPAFVSADPNLMEDGETYQDKVRFEMFVQPA